jgi:hypothetical protein
MSTHAENQETTEPDNTNVGLIATVVVVGALLVVSTAAALTALVRVESNRHAYEVGAYANIGAVQRLKAEQRAKLEQGPAWADKSKGLVALPIDRAMQLVVEQVSKNPNLATPEAPAVAQPSVDGQPSQGAAPAGAEPAKEGTPTPAQRTGDKGKDEKGTQGNARGGAPLKVEAPKGAPVVPAGAPVPRE